MKLFLGFLILISMMLETSKTNILITKRELTKILDLDNYKQHTSRILEGIGYKDLDYKKEEGIKMTLLTKIGVLIPHSKTRFGSELSMTKEEIVKTLFIFYNIQEDLNKILKKDQLTQSDFSNLSNKVKQISNKFNFHLHGNLFLKMEDILSRKSTFFIKDLEVKDKDFILLNSDYNKNIKFKNEYIKAINSKRKKPLFLDYSIQERCDILNRNTIEKTVGNLEKLNRRYIDLDYINFYQAEKGLEQGFKKRPDLYKGIFESEDFDSIGISNIKNKKNDFLTKVLIVDNFVEDNLEPNFRDKAKKEVVNLINEERIKMNLKPLKILEDDGKYADLRAKELVSKFSHSRPDDTDFNSGMKYKFGVGENIAGGQRTAKQVVKDWLESPGHRANILHKNFTHISIGVYIDSKSNYQYHWVQHFYTLN